MPTPSIVCLLLLIALLRALRGPRIGALAGLLHAWWLAPAGVVTPCIALGIILLAPQMPDMFAGMADGADGQGWWRLGRGLGCASGVLGLASWYWTRAGLNAEAGQDDRDAPYDPALAGATPFWDWFKAGYHQAPRWAALPAALMAISPPVLAWLHPSLNLPYHFGAAAVSLAIFLASVLPFTIYRRANVAAALVPLALWFVLLLTMPDGTRPWWIAIATVTVLLVLAYVAQRRDWVPKHIPKWIWRYPPLGLIAGAPLGWPVGILVLTAAAVACYASDTWPLVVPALFRAPSAAMVALGLVAGPFALGLIVVRSLAFPWRAWAALPGGRTAKLLVGTAGFVWLVFATPTGLEQLLSPKLYEIHLIDSSLPLPPLPGLREALARWRDAQINTCGHPREAPLPVIIAAAEGGASRAAVWFLSAAAMLDDDKHTAGRFGQYLFAISGVSGGSLGAVTYLQALNVDRANHASPCHGPRPDTMSAGLGTMVTSDPLSPALAGFFLNDALMRLLPLHRVWGNYNDRAVMLEYGFQRNWVDWWPKSQAGQGWTTSREGFVSLRESLGDLAPHLFLNGTDVDNGRRLITSTVRFDPADQEFPLAEDLLGRFGFDVAAATAVTNSARFPLLSPPGRIAGRQVIDGGYFDNYGSRTADDLVLAIERIGKANGWNLVPIVVLVTNDADTAQYDLPRFAASCLQPYPSLPDADAPPASAEVAGNDNLNANSLKLHQTLAARGEAARSPTIEGGAPVIGLIATRGAHGVDGLQILRRRLCHPDDPGKNRLIHIALPRPGAGDAAPMNWVLNEAAGRFMLSEAPAIWFNDNQARLLADILDEILSASNNRRWEKEAVE